MDDLEDEDMLNLDCSNLSSDEDDINNYDDVSELYDRDLDPDDLELVENEESNVSLNNKYRTVLEELRREVILELQRCKEKKAIIESRILELDSATTKPPGRKNWYNLFGCPYFKDRHFFPCPINEDAKEKRAKNQIDYHQVPALRKWVPSDCKKLEEAVKANAIEMKTLELMKQQGSILQKLRSSELSAAEEKKLSSELKGINYQIECVKNTNTSALFGDINKSFDWLKITAEAFGELRCSEEVRAMWILCRHPSINRKHWTAAESKVLKEVALRNKEQDWAKIAFELNTNRSQFQCVIQYQRHVNEDLRNHKWTDEEDELLKHIISKCRVGDTIPWSTVTMCMTNRSRAQVYHRWQNSINPDIRRGRFSAEEDCLIMAGAKRFGRDFTRISELLPGRTTSQVYARYTQCLVRIGPLGRWTKEEDSLLLKLVEEEGRKWHKLTPHFHGRNRNQVRHRYNFLQEWLAKNPDAAIDGAPRRNVGDCSQRNSILWGKIQSILNQTAEDKAVKEDCEGLNDEDLAILKSTLSKRITKKKQKCGKKAKPLSEADQMLDEFARVSYLMVSGRRKAVFSEEEKKERFQLMLKYLNAMEARLSFSFDPSIIEEDEFWNDADKYVLCELKKKFDEMNQRRESIADSSMENSLVPCPANSQSAEPFPVFSSGTMFHFRELFPANSYTLVGFRTVLLSRANLRAWKNTPRSEVIAVPSVRAPKDEESENKGLTVAESRKLFSERMNALFKWPCHLAVSEPALTRDTYETEEESGKPDRKRKKTIQKTGLMFSPRLILKINSIAALILFSAISIMHFLTKEFISTRLLRN